MAAWHVQSHGFRVAFLGGAPDTYPKLTVYPVSMADPVTWAAVVHESPTSSHWLSENFDSPHAAERGALSHARTVLGGQWHATIDRLIAELDSAPVQEP